MDIKELRKLPLPKLRDLAKESTELTGVIGMKKEDLIEAVAKAKGIAYEAPAKDVSAISSIKHEIRELRKQNSELLASSRDPIKVGRLRRKIKKLKRLTRQLAREAGAEKSARASAGGEAKPAASP
jgi:hypothetical protein